ncbi:hypothetical protein CBL_00289 [Carabus blaptoides fortunei]
MSASCSADTFSERRRGALVVWWTASSDTSLDSTAQYAVLAAAVGAAVFTHVFVRNRALQFRKLVRQCVSSRLTPPALPSAPPARASMGLEVLRSASADRSRLLAAPRECDAAVPVPFSDEPQRLHKLN